MHAIRLMWVLACATILAFAAAAVSTSKGQGLAVPRFEPGPCAVATRDTVRTRCGTLVVAEDRARTVGPRLRLPVIVLRSASASPVPDPVVRVSGGPGASSFGGVNARALMGWLAERDMIMLEQRGTSYASPSLACPEVDSALVRAALTDLPEAAADSSEVTAAIACRRRLLAAGVNLDAYTSLASVADLEDLRTALGIARWNLYGISYGARIALEYARDYPTRVRSVVLDSPLPLEVNYDETATDGVLRALTAIFTACGADSACGSAYPSLPERFASLLAAADTSPILIRVAAGNRDSATVRLTGQRLLGGVNDRLSLVEFIRRLPTLVAQGRSDTAMLRMLAADRLQLAGFAWGMRYSVWCAEEMPFERRDAIAAQRRRAAVVGGFAVQGSMPRICEVWSVRPASPAENMSVRTNVPALVLSGEFDPNTPPAWARQVAANIPRSQLFVFAGLTHVTANNGCVRELIALFLHSPEQRPAPSCLATLERPTFQLPVPGR